MKRWKGLVRESESGGHQFNLVKAYETTVCNRFTIFYISPPFSGGVAKTID
jgi:hypothetical protein